MNALRRIAGACALAVSWACAESVDVERERAALMEVDREFARATAAEGVEGWVRYFATDGSLIRPGRLVTGHDAIREAMAFLNDTSIALLWEPTAADVGAAGDLGYVLGRYELRRGAQTVVVGTYLTVWKRQADGSWKAVLDQGTPDG